MRTPRVSVMMRRNCAITTTSWTLLGSVFLFAFTSAAAGVEVGQGKANSSIPLKITNSCSDTIWPAFATQAGKGPSTGGFELKTNSSKEVTVSHNWQGRVWGRTNCSFNLDGTKGSNGASRACETGDCGGALSCVVTGNTPVTLFEITLIGGSENKQSFYDISLVDGYNLPIGVTYIPGKSNSLDIPPNLTNCACVATAGHITAAVSNDTFPTPYNTKTTNKDLARWCPWDLQLNPPTKPGDGVFPYPDDNIQRPVFSPCLSGCAKTNSAQDCCTGSYDSPSACKPNLYAHNAKRVCPDAYSYAFDDTTSTFIIPSGGGWEVTFCPTGASTNILKTFGKELSELAQTGKVSAQVLADAQNITLVQQQGSAAHLGLNGPGSRDRMGSLGALVVMLAWVCLW